jgi:lipid-binding SYLF domain-containing protein
MKRISVFAFLLTLGIVHCWSQTTQQGKTAEQQSQTAAQQSQTAAQQSQTAAQQSQTAAQQSQTAAQQSQIAVQEQQKEAQSAQSMESLQAKLKEEQQKVSMVEGKERAAARLGASADVMKGVLTGRFLLKGQIEKAKCVVIIPSQKRIGFVFGGDYGRGTMTCHLGGDYNGPWSAPSMVALEGGNFGFQIGFQTSDLIFLVMNERGVNSLLSSKSKLGADASVAAGPFGRSLMGATDGGMKADIIAFARTGGVYGGAVVNGSSLRPDHKLNRALYDRQLTPREIVRSGLVPVPVPGKPLINLLDSQRKVAASAPSGGENK